MIRVRDIALQPGESSDRLRLAAAQELRIPAAAVRSVRLIKRSVDARKKPDVKIVCSVDVCVDGDEERILRKSGSPRASIAPTLCYRPPTCAERPERRPVVIGFGPAGMFAALLLAKAGLRPLVLERGEDAQTRHEKVERFFCTGRLDTRSNVQFGEGGAGTFSDGKLNTGVNNPRIAWVLERFVEFGAEENILYDAKPHVGTDVLLGVVQNLRREIIRLGGEVRFGTQVTGLYGEGGRLTALGTERGERIACDCAILAIGHSARDTVRMLHREGLAMAPKPFAMGVRIEHRQSFLNTAQYGWPNPALPPADYKLAVHLAERSVYTFCMCPGGYVIAAASEAGRTVTNGMSYSGRSGENANAALLVSVSPSDFPKKGALGGMEWQEAVETAAFREGYRAPAQTVGDFLAGRASAGPCGVVPTYRPGVAWCDLHTVLPDLITGALEEALPKLDGKLPGFADAGAVLTAPETRSSSPVRILRGEDGQASMRGLYPAGEGAGYAGGIMSAAMDGMLSAERVIAHIKEEASWK